MSATNQGLRPKLADAQKALAAALDEACHLDVEHANVEELLRLEEQLAVARESADRVIAALQRLGHQHDEKAAEEQDAHRIHVDDSGVQWDAFVVRPSRSKGKDTLPPPYDRGWLAVQCPDGVRRVTPIPERWKECSREEFCALVDGVPVTPRRRM